MADVYQKKYVSSQGERWDTIALAFYGNALNVSPLIEANPKYRSVVVFPAGYELTIPILEENAAESLPPWKR
ncbi:tail protein X [Oscillibacter ruminantium]|uniref:tail protein X n=1 Tax=Oscillibacter ruminantium TaxID=1263547 RepID=UPI00058C1519|nr:tail protein X [Oscillibacter ruminantium]